VHAASAAAADDAVMAFLAAVTIADGSASAPPVVHEVIGVEATG